MNLRRAALTCVCTLALPLLGMGSARADSASDPTITATTPAYSGFLVTVDFTLDDPNHYVQSVNVVLNGSTLMTITADRLPSYASGSGYEVTHVNTLPDGAVGTITVNGTTGGSSVTSSPVTTTSDRVRPVVTFDPNDLANQANPTVTVKFTATDAHLVSTGCSIDDRPALACSSSVTFTGVGTGNHQVNVTAGDAAGNYTTQSFNVFNADAGRAGVAGTLPEKLLAGSRQTLQLLVNSYAIPALTPTGTVSVSEGGRVIGVATLTPGAMPGSAVASIPIAVGKSPGLFLAYDYSGDVDFPASRDLTEFTVFDPAAVTASRAQLTGKAIKFRVACPTWAYGHLCRGTATVGHHATRYSVQAGKSLVVTVPVTPAALAASARTRTTSVTLKDATRRTVKLHV